MGSQRLAIDPAMIQDMPDNLKLGRVVLGPDFVEIADARAKKPHRFSAKGSQGAEDSLNVIRRRVAAHRKGYKIDPTLRLRVLIGMQDFFAQNGIEGEFETFEGYARALMKQEEFVTTSLKMPVEDGYEHFIVHDNVLMHIDPARSHFGEQIAQDLYHLLLREFDHDRTIPAQQFCRQVINHLGNDKLSSVVFLKLRNRLTLHVYSRGNAHKSLLEMLEEGDESERQLFGAKRRRHYRKRKDMKDPERSSRDEINRDSVAIKLRAAPEEVALIDLFAGRDGESRTAFLLKAAWERIRREDPALASEFEADPQGFMRLLKADGLEELKA